MNRSKKVRTFVQVALFIAIIAIIAFPPLGPILGSIQIGSGIVATTAHIPVIIAAIMLGPKIGALIGFVFGFFSFIVMSFVSPGPTSFVFTPLYSFAGVSGNFWSLVICFVPRILIGVVAGLLFKAITRGGEGKEVVFGAGIAAFCGSVTNTVLVLGGIYVFFGEQYAAAIGQSYSVLLGLLGTVLLTNGVMEAALAMIIAMAAVKPLLAVNKRDKAAGGG